MTPEVMKKQDITVIIPQGELDTHNCSELRDTLSREMEKGATKLLVDLSRVGYMDSAALGVLVSGLKRAREKKAQLKLSGVHGPVEKIFNLTRLTKFFEIYDSLDEALAKF